MGIGWEVVCHVDLVGSVVYNVAEWKGKSWTRFRRRCLDFALGLSLIADNLK